MPSNDDHVVTQIGVAAVARTAAQRAAEVVAALKTQDAACESAMQQLKGLRTFVGRQAEIIGNPLTKHGEIAERVEVAVRNARDLVRQQPPTATFEGVSRLDSTDVTAARAPS
jgi:hypothetical protein